MAPSLCPPLPPSAHLPVPPTQIPTKQHKHCLTRCHEGALEELPEGGQTLLLELPLGVRRPICP